MSSSSIAPGSLEQRHRTLTVQEAIADTLVEIQRAIAAVVPSEITSARCDELTEETAHLYLYLGQLFYALREQESSQRVTLLVLGEREYWAFRHEGRMRAVLTVRGVDRVVADRDDVEELRALCLAHSQRLRVVGGAQ